MIRAQGALSLIHFKRGDVVETMERYADVRLALAAASAATP